MAKKKPKPRAIERPPADAKLDHIAEDLRALAEPVDQLTPDPNNARKHGDRNLQSIRESLDNFGQVSPLIVNAQTGVVVIGNGRLAVAQELGWTWIAVVRRELTPTEHNALALVDNHSADLAEWDQNTLDEMIAELANEAPDLLETLTLDDLLSVAIDEDENVADQAVPDRYEVIIECQSEDDQKQWHEKLTKQGANVRLLVC